MLFYSFIKQRKFTHIHISLHTHKLSHIQAKILNLKTNDFDSRLMFQKITIFFVKLTFLLYYICSVFVVIANDDDDDEQCVFIFLLFFAIFVLVYFVH